MPERADIKVWRTLRGRLVLAMFAMFVLAVACSTLLDEATGPVARLLDREPYQDGLVLALFSLPALALIWLVSSWSLRPLIRASEEARRAGPHNPAARLSRAGMTAEIAPLVDAVNGALDRMAAAFAAERRFTENAAHELRTPLAVLGLRLQRARHAGPGAAPDWPAIEADLAQMNRLVEQLLDLARKEHAGRAADMGGVNLSRLAREAAAGVLPLIEARGRTLSVDVPDALPMRGMADDVRDAVRNLLENAAVHGRGHIRLHGIRQDGLALIEVSDEGTAPVDDTLFERFRKSGASAGSGLGLAIVREVARSHGGDAAFLPGPACRVRVTLPLA